jgi:PEP-CTERM motif
VYAAGTSDPPAPDSRNNTDPYYAVFGGVTAPAQQQALYGSQSGTTATGTLGMAWHDMLIEKSGDNVSWYVDNLRIATVPIAGATLGGENIFFGMFDINATSSSDPNDFLNAAIFDNIRVDLVPEPSSVALCGLAMAGLVARRRRR